MNLDSFISKANEIHGDQYDYTNAVYAGSKAPLEIICPKHGLFKQIPQNHLRGRGCAKCAKEALANHFRKTTATFIADARKVHGDAYDYAKVDYKQANAKVEIICPIHGIFSQSASSHLSGAGCPKCANEKTSERVKWTTRRFIIEAKKKFGEKFDYSEVDYFDSWKPVKIICPTHGIFEVAPVNFLHSIYGCQKCSHGEVNRDRILTTEQFLKRAKEIHGDKYDYSKVKVKDSKCLVNIICRKHGEFKQVAGTHLAGKGCKLCGNVLVASKQRQPQEHFIKRAREIHGEKYDYSQLDYKSARKNVEIICPTHGVFKQTPDTHLKSGCRKCADEELTGYYSDKLLKKNPEVAKRAAIIYYIEFSSVTEKFFKVGITVSSVKLRFGGYGSKTGYKIKIIKQKKTTLEDAYRIEQVIKNTHGKLFQYKPMIGNKDDRFAGHTECFGKPLPANLSILLDD